MQPFLNLPHSLISFNPVSLRNIHIIQLKIRAVTFVIVLKILCHDVGLSFHTDGLKPRCPTFDNTMHCIHFYQGKVEMEDSHYEACKSISCWIVLPSYFTQSIYAIHLGIIIIQRDLRLNLIIYLKSESHNRRKLT